MNSNRKIKSSITDKKEQKLVRYFNSKLSKDNYRIKPKKIYPNKEKKPKVDIISPPKHISQNPNKTSTKLITPNETNSKTIKKIIPKNNFKLKEISENQHSKIKDENFISMSSIGKNKFLLEEKNINNTIINNIENNSNIHIGSNNKITIIKNIFNRGNKPLSKSKNQIQNKKIMVSDIKMRIIKLKNRNNYTLSGNAKKSKKIYKGVRNTSRKKMINRQSLSTYNSIDNLNNENNYFLTSNNKNIIHCNTISNNLKLSSNIKNYKNKLSISLENSKKKFYMNLSHSNFLNTCPSLINCKNDVKHKIKNIKTIKTLSINADHKYKKIYHNIKRKKFQKKINLIRCLNKLTSPKLIIKNKISSTIGNNNANYIQEKDNENNEKSINNNESINKGTIDNLKSKKSNNFYEKIKKINLQSVRSKSINVNLINNAKHKKYNSDINNNNNNNSSLMNVRLNNKFFQKNLKNIELSESKHLKNKISPSIRNNNNKSNQNYYEIIHKQISPPFKSLNSINNPDEKSKINSSDLKNKIKIINKFYKSKDFLIEKNNSKLIENIPIKKYNTNLNNNDSKKDNVEEKNNIKNMEIEEEQIFNNINQNSLTMYSIYILSKYNESYDKIGLSQIYLYDNKNIIIPVLYSNSNCDFDCSILFYSAAKPVKISNKQTKYSTIKKQNHPFICEFKQNLYINFFVKNIQSNKIHHIKIINYYNKKQKISASKDIKIYQGNLLLYDGILSIDKPNIIIFAKKGIEKEKNDIKYIDKNINSTLSTTSRKNFSFINSNNSNTNIKKK